MSATGMGSAEVTVSVAMITYNHERFIAQAIESVLMQQTDFAVELVIGEDCSTDGTRAIVRDYSERYPECIRLLLPERNLGMIPNLVATLNACRGHYISLLEGDDYWISPDKLQRQVDLMRSNQNCVFCGSRAFTWRDGDATPYGIVPDQPAETLASYGLEELFVGKWWLKTCTRLYQRQALESIPVQCLGDWMMTLYIAAKWPDSRVGFVDEVLAVYREHAGGIWSSSTAADRALTDLVALHGAQPFFTGRFERLLNLHIVERHLGLASSPGIRFGARLAHWWAIMRLQPWNFRLWWAMLISLGAALKNTASLKAPIGAYLGSGWKD